MSNGPADDGVRVGRRNYDDQVPTVVYIEEKLMRVFEEQLRKTHDSLRQDISVLGTAVQAATLKSTQEHGQVQLQLAGISAILAEIPPLKVAVAALEKSDAADTGAADVTRTIWKAAGILAGLLIAASGVLVAVL